jgi:hypothetical protein
VVDLNKAHPCPFERNPLDLVAPLGGPADVMPGPLVFETGNRVAVPVGNQEVATL